MVNGCSIRSKFIECPYTKVNDSENGVQLSVGAEMDAYGDHAVVQVATASN